MRMLNWVSAWGLFVLSVAIFLMPSGAQAAAPVVVGGELMGAAGVDAAFHEGAGA